MSEGNNEENQVAGSAEGGAEGDTEGDTEGMSEGASEGVSEGASEDASEDASDGTTPGPRRKRRRRRRKKKEHAPEEPVEAAVRTEVSESPPVQDPGWQSLATGLLSHLDERQIPCKVDGCDNTWTWTAQEQMQAFGQPPPRRMCAQHQAALTAVEDREIPCQNPGCTRTWTWPKKAQVAQLQKTGTSEPPRKVCPECVKEERELADREVPCRVEGCTRTWTWPRDAQLKHRTWARRAAEERPTSSPEARSPGGKRRRRRRRPSVDVNQPPFRMCTPCRDKLARLEEREVPCKVHGCTRSAVMDRESQLRAWAKLRTEDLDREVSLVRRMCESCRDFCRNHPDREVACGRPGCLRTWTYKTGAQLQDSLAGRRQDPIRLCLECAKGGLVAIEAGRADGMEVLPCVVSLCDGVWFYREGVTEVAPGGWVDQPLDRMCDRCREERGAEPRRDQLSSATEVEPEASSSEEGSDASAEDAHLQESQSAEPAETPQDEPAALVVDEAGAANEAAAANEPTAANEPIAANDGEPEDGTAPEDLPRNE